MGTARPRTGVRFVLRAVRCSAMLVLALSACAPEVHAGPGRPLPLVRAHDGGLWAGAAPLRVYGFNWGAGDRHAVTDYFDDPTPERLAVLEEQLARARSLGANGMRVALELQQVMAGPARVRRRTLAALQRLLALAERHRVYVDITGNVLWRSWLAPGWYEGLDEAARWDVQARFWRAVARAAHASPAVLCFELTSEPAVGVDPAAGWYFAELGGYRFGQFVAMQHDRDPLALARAWTARMAAAVRAEDSRPVTIGLLPTLEGAFTPGNVADLLDVLVVHEYAQPGAAAKSVRLLRAFAGHGKPLLLGETFALFCDPATQRRFLLRSAPHLVGVLSFFDGRLPADVPPDAPMSEHLYKSGLESFVALRGELVARWTGR